MGNAEGDADRDLWGRGSRRWLCLVWKYVRAGRVGGRENHTMMRRRFATHWHTLEAYTWRPLMQRARERDAWAWGSGLTDWRCSFLAAVLESAYWWGLDLHAEHNRTGELRAAVDELRNLDRELQDRAGQMAALFERRGELRERFNLTTEAPGPPDLWDVLTEVASWPQYRGTLGDPAAGLSGLVRYMRQTTRPTPDLADVLGAYAASVHGEPVALHPEDREALAKRQGARAGAWPEHLRVLFAALASPELMWRDRRGREASALDCFTPAALSTLANVAAGFDPFDGGPPALGVEAVEKALQRFRD
jgi:hypothetical protein